MASVDRRALRLRVRTPRELVAEFDVASLRVATSTGQVGLRPRCEPTVLPVEPGLAIARTVGGLRFVGTVGGLLRTDGREAMLLTPVAVVGDSVPDVAARLDEALTAPDPEREVRRLLERLEVGILLELRRGDGAPGRGPRRSAA
jgi:F0F1-type ATP synthase epsilon subunit